MLLLPAGRTVTLLLPAGSTVTLLLPAGGTVTLLLPAGSTVTLLLPCRVLRVGVPCAPCWKPVLCTRPSSQ